MTFDEKKEFLKCYKDMELDLKLTKKAIQNLRDSQMIGGMHYSDMPKSHTVSDQLAAYAGRIDEQQQRLKLLSDGLDTVIASILTINDPKKRLSVGCYYCEDKTWGEVSAEARCSVRTAMRLAHEGVEDMRISNIDIAKSVLTHYARTI